MPSRHRILLSHVAPRRLRHHPELVQPHHRVVAHLELQAGLLLELAQEVRLLLHEVQRHLRMEAHGELALLVVGSGPLERALHPAHDDFGPEHAAGAVARRALGGHRLPERGSHALARHLDQSQLRDRERLGAGAIAAEVRAQLLQHLVAVAARLHVDEVHNDDSTDVPQAELSRHLARRFEVGLHDRALGVFLARVAPRVHVDRRERLGRLDDEVPPRREIHARLEQVADLRLDVVLVEQRRLGLVRLHPREQIGIDLFEILHDLVVQHLGVDQQRVDLVREEVANDPPGEAGLTLQQRRGAHRAGLPFDLLPQAVQVIDLALAALLGQVLGDGADDPAARVFRDELRHQVAQLSPLLAVLDLPGDADLGGERHVHEKPPRERDLRGDARPLRADRLLDDLNDLRFTALQLVGDVRQAATAGTATAVCSAVAVFVCGIGRLLLVLRLDQVGRVEKGALDGPDVDERGLDPREHGFDRAEVDVAHRAAGDIYLGTVEAVLPGIQAAFVNIGADKSAFLHASDLIESEDEEEPSDPADENGNCGANGASRSGRRGLPNIADELKRGEAKVVQVTKEPISTKGPRVTAQISLAGRFLVYMPFASKVGVSRKIENREQRAKLRDLVSKLVPKDEGGWIIRTVADDLTEETCKREIDHLFGLWKKVQRKAKSVRAPALLQRETSLTRS